ncbi:MAG: DUF11 domain-containing protein [Phycisphaerales bacterium]|nr:DUF11 domain-containing protein [Phycisphaerales bacterium]
MIRSRAFAVALLLSATPYLFAQSIDNKGIEFITSFMPNFFTPQIELHLTGEQHTMVTVTYPVRNPTFTTTVAVNPGQVTIVALPYQASSVWPLGIVANNAVRAVSLDGKEFIVYQINRVSTTSDAALGLPINALNTEYIISGYYSTLTRSDRGQFTVVAVADDTDVTITPKQELAGPGAGYPAGLPFMITLDRGEGFLAQSKVNGLPGDLTGSIVSSSRPVAVSNGNKCANVPADVYACDHVFETAHPTATWGHDIFVANLPLRPNGSFYRVVGSVNGTPVTMDGAALGMVNRGAYLEVGPLTGIHVFSATNPIFVTQYMTGQDFTGAEFGDPAMGNAVPAEQYLNAYTFSTVGGNQFDHNFLTLFAMNADIGQVLLDGVAIPAASFAPVPGSNFSAVVLPLGQGTHETFSPNPHGITVEGYDDFDSYIYPGGALFRVISRQDEDDPVCSLTVHPGPPDSATGEARDDRTEDTNGNGDLDPGEDLDMDGRLDEDSGIQQVFLEPNSVNLILTVDPFQPSDPVVTFTVTLDNPVMEGRGHVRALDFSQNYCRIPVRLNALDPASVGDRVWMDRDRDGRQDAGEPGIAGVSVALLDANGVIDTTVTDANGLYTFDNVLPGSRYVRFTPPTGYVFSPRDAAPDTLDSDADTTTGESAAINLQSGDTRLDIDAGMYPVADVRISKSGPTLANRGEQIVFTLTSHNNGPAVATNVAVTDVLPSNVSFVMSDGAYNSATGVWTIGTLAVNADATLHITVTVDDDATSDIQNTATIEGAEFDPALGNNTAMWTVGLRSANLSVTKSANPSPALAGAALTYTIMIHNAGPQAATNVVVRDTLPTGVTYNDAGSTTSCGEGPAGVVECAIGTIGVGGNATVTIATVVDADRTAPLVNDVLVSSDIFDPNESDNAFRLTTPVSRETHFTVEKTATGTAVGGGQLDYTIHMTNNGPANATHVVMTDELPQGLTLVPGSLDPNCAEGPSNVVRCNIGSLNVGQMATRTFSVSIDPNARGLLVNEACVTADELAEPACDDARTTIGGSADLSIVKTDDQDPVTALTPLIYFLDVTNAGPSVARNVVVDDYMPAGTSFNAGESSPGCAQLGTQRIIRCTLPQLNVNETRRITIGLNVGSSVRGVITNRATVTSDDMDPNPNNNEDTETTTVTGAADMYVEKTVDRENVIACNELTYTIRVGNNGPSNGTNVIVDDPVPGDTTFVSATTSAGNYNPATGRWTVGMVTVGGTQTLTLRVMIGSKAPPQITNTATVTASEGDPFLDNNTDSVIVNVFKDEIGAPGMKGSVLVLPKVDLRWDPTGRLVRDTIISIANDGEDMHAVKVFYVDGASCEVIDFGMFLTREEPFYWSLAAPRVRNAQNQSPRSFTDLASPVGRPDPDGSGYTRLRGALIVMAASNDFTSLIRYNHLTAKATMIDYELGACAEYDAYAFRSQIVEDGEVVSDEAIYFGADVDFAPSEVLLDTFTDGSTALTRGANIIGEVLTNLTLLRLDLELNQQSDTSQTLAFMTVFNQDELPLTWSGQDFCIRCWGSEYISAIRPDVFDIDFFNTDRVKARISGVASLMCGFDNAASPVIGVQTRFITFGNHTAMTATSLVGAGKMHATMRFGGSVIPGGDLEGPDGGPPPRKSRSDH